ncbi:MAG: hypothetical protein HY300_09760 [Verrucomicrobia bacterium]|nr:hypothetical protein [Verrucomicrobiota bacterium]
MKRTLALAIGLSLALGAGTALAGGKKGNKGELVKGKALEKLLPLYDANKNGKLDPEEKEAMNKDVLAKFDTNKDGKLDKDEQKALAKALKKGTFEPSKPEEKRADDAKPAGTDKK